jgi:hypothetical protein
MTKKIASSPDKHKLRSTRAQDKPELKKFYESFAEREQKNIVDPAWQENNLEYDLRTTDWIIEKARNTKSYAQNIYAALCNNDFQKMELWPILQDQTWGCSWRYAGGIVADLRGQGDYLDWYCSGMNNYSLDLDPKDYPEYVAEGVVTQEVEEDLAKLGWKVLPTDEEL